MAGIEAETIATTTFPVPADCPRSGPMDFRLGVIVSGLLARRGLHPPRRASSGVLRLLFKVEDPAVSQMRLGSWPVGPDSRPSSRIPSVRVCVSSSSTGAPGHGT